MILIQSEYASTFAQFGHDVFEIVKAHEVIAIASIAVSGAFGCASAGYVLGLFHQESRTKGIIEGALSEIADLRRKVAVLITAVGGLVSLPPPRDYAKEASAVGTSNAVRGLLSRSRWRRGRSH